MKQQTRRVIELVRLLGLGVIAAGCDDPLTDPAVIEGPRIVGARVAAQADPTLAEPAAGGAASIEWFVLSNEPGSFSAKVAFCSAAPSVLGAPRCGASAFAEQTASGVFDTPLRFEFSVPPELAPGSAWLSWIGICASGEPVFDAVASAFRCAEGEALSGFYRGFVPEAVPNRNPSLGDDTLLLGGAAWAPSESAAAVPGSACRERGHLALPPDEPSTIVFELGGDDREPLASADGSYAGHERESLVYTHLASHPGLERAFSAIDFDAELLRFEVPFEFTGVAPGPEGELSSFYLLVRDERGGVDWLRRDACLISPDIEQPTGDN
jgi:hypothetical protein